jgi:hypothetical protein
VHTEPSPSARSGAPHWDTELSVGWACVSLNAAGPLRCFEHDKNGILAGIGTSSTAVRDLSTRR